MGELLLLTNRSEPSPPAPTAAATPPQTHTTEAASELLP